MTDKQPQFSGDWILQIEVLKERNSRKRRVYTTADSVPLLQESLEVFRQYISEVSMSLPDEERITIKVFKESGGEIISICTTEFLSGISGTLDEYAHSLGSILIESQSISLKTENDLLGEVIQALECPFVISVEDIARLDKALSSVTKQCSDILRMGNKLEKILINVPIVKEHLKKEGGAYALPRFITTVEELCNNSVD